jgi:hypothetical protein
MKKRRALSMPFLITAALSPAPALADTATPPKPPVTKKLPKPTHPERVQRNPNGTCTEYPDMHCPPDVHCNPGPPREVECPPEPEKKK